MCAEVRIPDLDCTLQGQDKRLIVSAMVVVFSAVHLALFVLGSVMRSLGRSTVQCRLRVTHSATGDVPLFNSGLPLFLS